jgi:hypothetical protein
MGQDSIVGQSFILLNAKTHFIGLAADLFVAQTYILLIWKKQFIERKKGRRFRAGCKRGLWVDLCGLHPARKRSKGVWGLWKIAPN